MSVPSTVPRAARLGSTDETRLLKGVHGLVHGGGGEESAKAAAFEASLELGIDIDYDLDRLGYFDQRSKPGDGPIMDRLFGAANELVPEVLWS